MKSSPSIWHYVVNIKLMVKISLIFGAFSENVNFTIWSRTAKCLTTTYLTAVQTPDNSLMSAWQPEECLITAWRVPDDLWTTACLTTAWIIVNQKLL